MASDCRITMVPWFEPGRVIFVYEDPPLQEMWFIKTQGIASAFYERLSVIERGQARCRGVLVGQDVWKEIKEYNEKNS